MYVHTTEKIFAYKNSKLQTNIVKVDSTSSLALIWGGGGGLTARSFQKERANIFNPLGITIHNSAFLQYLHDSPHSFRPSENIMDILHIIMKGNYMTALQKFYTYSDTKNNNQ
jgi:hypothetical protein